MAAPRGASSLHRACTHMCVEHPWRRQQMSGQTSAGHPHGGIVCGHKNGPGSDSCDAKEGSLTHDASREKPPATARTDKPVRPRAERPPPGAGAEGTRSGLWAGSELPSAGNCITPWRRAQVPTANVVDSSKSHLYSELLRARGRVVGGAEGDLALLSCPLTQVCGADGARGH